MIMEIVQPKRDYLIQKIIIQPELKIVNGIFPFEILVEYVPEILDFMIYYDENKITYRIEIDMYDINKNKIMISLTLICIFSLLLCMIFVC